MAISPINKVSFRNNYNQVSFEGKNKEKSHHTSSIKTTLRAIPLATLIAMSPLNSVEANSNVGLLANENGIELVNDDRKIDMPPKSADIIQSKEFKYGDGYEVKVSLIKDNKNPGSKKIWMDWSLGEDIGGRGYITRSNHLKYHIKGNDTKLVDNVVFDAVYMQDFEHRQGKSHSFSNSDVCAYVNQLIRNNKTNVPEKNITKDLYLWNSRLMSTDGTDTEWLEDAKEPRTWGISNVVGYRVSTEKGTYQVFGLDRDEDKSNFERVVVYDEATKATFEVESVCGGLAQFATVDNLEGIKKVDLPIIIMKARKGGTRSICNQKLWEVIVAFLQDSRNNKAIDGFNRHFEYYPDADGDIIPRQIDSH